MSERGYISNAAPIMHLPPREVRLFDPNLNEGKIPTPIDERGLVDMLGLISVMRSTVESEYDWASAFSDEHHLQWPDRWYPKSDEGSEYSANIFRNLAISKVIVPRVFHNWVHRITEPPPMPSEEVMRYRIDAQRVALALFKEVRSAKTVARHRHMGEEGLEELLTERFDTFAHYFEKAKQTPREFQLLEYENYSLRDTTDMVHIGTKLGKFAVTASATDRVRRAIAA